MTTTPTDEEIAARIEERLLDLANVYRKGGVEQDMIVNTMVQTLLALSVATRGVPATIAALRDAADGLARAAEELVDPRVHTAH